MCAARHDESCVRVESVEEHLCQLSDAQREMQYDQASIMLRLESQQMYSRKQTLLVTGPAVEPPSSTRGEDVRGTVLRLLSCHLGITDLQTRDICACHRLKNPKVILIRFTNLDHSERVYRARTKPKVRGLLIFESLTAERLSVINMIKALKEEGDPHVLSYYTQGGKILVRTSEDRDVKPVEIPFGLDKSQIQALCGGGRVAPTALAVCDQFRAVNSGTNTIQKPTFSKRTPWTLVRPRGQRPKPASGRDDHTEQPSRPPSGRPPGGAGRLAHQHPDPQSVGHQPAGASGSAASPDGVPGAANPSQQAVTLSSVQSLALRALDSETTVEGAVGDST